MNSIPSRASRALQGRAWRFVFAAALTALYLLACMAGGPIASLTRFACEGDRAAFTCLTGALLLAVLLALALRRRMTPAAFLAACAGAVAALLVRLHMFDQVSADYASFLERWVDTFREGGFGMIREEIGDYNLPYLYILALIARSPISDLYLIKLVSVAFDFALALMMMETVHRFIDERASLPVFLAVLALPTVWWNSAYWAQCDALYVFFVVACLYALLAGRPVVSASLLSLAFCFKLQTIFFFPMVLFGLLHGKYRWRHALAFAGTYLLTLVPALLAGRSLLSALTIYLNQSLGQYSDRLTYNAASIYQFFPQVELANAPQWPWVSALFDEHQTMDVSLTRWYFTLDTMWWLQNATLIAAAVIVLAALFFLWKRRRFLGFDQVWRMAAFSALFVPLVLPKMHDRYFYMADMLCLLYGVRYPRRAFVPMLVIGASFASYMPFLTRARGVPMIVASMMNIAALAFIARDILTELRARQAACPDAPCAQEASAPERV